MSIAIRRMLGGAKPKGWFAAPDLASDTADAA